MRFLDAAGIGSPAAFICCQHDLHFAVNWGRMPEVTHRNNHNNWLTEGIRRVLYSLLLRSNDPM